MSKEIVRVAARHSASVEFKGLFKVALHIGLDGKRYFVPTQLAEELGADPHGQRQRAQRSFPKGGCIMRIQTPGGPQDVYAVELKYLPAFLLGFVLAKVREEIRPRLEEIQEELYEALAAYTFEGAAVNPAFPAASLPNDPLAVLHACQGAALAEGDLARAAQLHAALGCLLPRPMASAAAAPVPGHNRSVGSGRGDAGDDEIMRQTLKENPGITGTRPWIRMAHINRQRGWSAAARLKRAGEVENRGNQSEPRLYWRDPTSTMQ